jgi:sugar O-acyltransferase (sialic acid O-acetyltransferase NeuD family)
MKLYGIIGAGGFGKGVIPLAHYWSKSLKDASELVFVVEDQYYTPNKEVIGYRVMSMTDFLTASADRYYNIAIADSKARERIANIISRDIARPFSITAPNYVSLHNNTIGEGAIFCSFSHITSNVTIGRFFHCNIYSYVEHDCVIGDFVTFAPRVSCNGHVIIEDHVYIGTGAIIKDGTDKPIIIGRGATVGMGAVVTKSVPPGITVVGNPAKPMVK